MAAPRFDARRQGKRRRTARWKALRWYLLLALILALGWATSRWLVPEPDPQALPASFTICGERSSAACVIDGDTVAIGGYGRDARRIRFTGFDAPELDGPCRAERAAAIRARTALADWLNAAPALVDGGEDPPRDRYGRELRAAYRADGTTLADHMLGRGLASDGGWGATSRDWCG